MILHYREGLNKLRKEYFKLRIFMQIYIKYIILDEDMVGHVQVKIISRL